MTSPVVNLMGVESGNTSSLPVFLKLLKATGWNRRLSYIFIFIHNCINGEFKERMLRLTFKTACKYGIFSKSAALNSESPRARTACSVALISFRRVV